MAAQNAPMTQATADALASDLATTLGTNLHTTFDTTNLSQFIIQCQQNATSLGAFRGLIATHAIALIIPQDEVDDNGVVTVAFFGDRASMSHQITGDVATVINAKYNSTTPAEWPRFH